MYVPSAFAETDLTRLHDFIDEYSFGVLLTQVGRTPFASHLPFLLERTAGTNGTLVGHVARANPQWSNVGGETSLAIFTGPHAYISPTWYEAEQVVPTWNYTAVHAYGQFRIVDDKESLLEIVQCSVQRYERSMPEPWSFDFNSTFIDRLLGQIVGFRIEIERIEGKFKLNQNHPFERRRKVVRALMEAGGENAEAVAAMMQATLPVEG